MPGKRSIPLPNPTMGVFLPGNYIPPMKRMKFGMNMNSSSSSPSSVLQTSQYEKHARNVRLDQFKKWNKVLEAIDDTTTTTTTIRESASNANHSSSNASQHHDISALNHKILAQKKSAETDAKRKQMLFEAKQLKRRKEIEQKDEYKAFVRRMSAFEKNTIVNDEQKHKNGHKKADHKAVLHNNHNHNHNKNKNNNDNKTNDDGGDDDIDLGVDVGVGVDIDIDPLEAFMANLESNTAKKSSHRNQHHNQNTNKKKKKQKRNHRMKNRRVLKSEVLYNDESVYDEGDLLLDAHGNSVIGGGSNSSAAAVIANRGASMTWSEISLDSSHSNHKKAKEKCLALLSVDHSAIEYTPFRKRLYVESREISMLTASKVEIIRRELLDKCQVRVHPMDNDTDMGVDIGMGVESDVCPCPRPILKWNQCGLSNKILFALTEKYMYKEPFPVQCQCIPIIMSGFDVLCIAKTGSGKTLAFVLPMLRHILDQPPLFADESGPISMIIAPTRELATQIYFETSKFCKLLELRICAVYGGSPVIQTINQLKKGCEIIVCTPGRMIDMLCTNNGRLLNLRRLTYVVLDEADRMFDLGFEPQISAILKNGRPDKQLLMFSATFPVAIQKLARKTFVNSGGGRSPHRSRGGHRSPGTRQRNSTHSDSNSETTASVSSINTFEGRTRAVHHSPRARPRARPSERQRLIQVSFGGNINTPCMDVTQFAFVIDVENNSGSAAAANDIITGMSSRHVSEEMYETAKFSKLLKLLGEWHGKGSILIFVDRREMVEYLWSKLRENGYFSHMLHGGIDQQDRYNTMKEFKDELNHNTNILICTSLASRGLDVHNLRVVINYCVPHHFEDYIHRIGRTGRGGQKGVSFTFICANENESQFAPIIIQAMKLAQQSANVSTALYELSQTYYDKVNCGELPYLSRNRGYNSKHMQGFKFDEKEDKTHKSNQLERERISYGNADEFVIDDECLLKNLEKNTNLTLLPATVAAAAAAAAAAKNDDDDDDDDDDDGDAEQNGNKKRKRKKKKKKREEQNVSTLQRKLNDFKHALKAAKMKKNAKNKAKVVEQTILKEQRKYEKKRRDRVSMITKRITAELEVNKQNMAANANNSVGGSGGGANADVIDNQSNFTLKLRINDYPLHVRRKITYRTTLNPLRENYNVNIHQRGVYIERGKYFNKNRNNPDLEDTKLHLEIHGNKRDVINCAKEVQRQLINASRSHNNHSQNNRTGFKKFSVL